MFNKIFSALAAKGGKPDQLMIDATHLKAHLTAASSPKKGLFPDASYAPKAAELQATRRDGKGRPLAMLLSEGQMSEYKRAALMIDTFAIEL